MSDRKRLENEMEIKKRKAQMLQTEIKKLEKKLVISNRRKDAQMKFAIGAAFMLACKDSDTFYSKVFPIVAKKITRKTDMDALRGSIFEVASNHGDESQ